MKKHFFYITIIVPALLLSACNKKEIFSPSRYIQTETFQEGSNDYEASMRFTYSENNQLVSVWLKEGNATLTFESNKDKTISKIISSENNGTDYALLSYEDKLITQIQYYEHNQLARESIFLRKEKKNTINKIENYAYDGFSSEGVLAAMLFADVKTMPESVRKMHKSGGKSLYSVQNISYENENIHRVRLSYVVDNKESLYSTTTYNYDDKKNPYYGLPYAFLKLTGYNKNNETYARTSFENDKYKTMITVESSYSYEKKYPIYRSVIESETYIIAFDSVGGPKEWATDTEYSSYQYTYK